MSARVAYISPLIMFFQARGCLLSNFLQIFLPAYFSLSTLSVAFETFMILNGSIKLVRVSIDILISGYLTWHWLIIGWYPRILTGQIIANEQHVHFFIESGVVYTRVSTTSG